MHSIVNGRDNEENKIFQLLKLKKYKYTPSPHHNKEQ